MMNKSMKSYIVGLVSLFLVITFLSSTITLNVYACEECAEVPYQESVSTNGKDSLVIVSMGDSYSAGEGLHDYYGGELPEKQRMQDPDFLSHRSKNAWPGMLYTYPGSDRQMVEEWKDNWFFVAMSGAITNNIIGGKPIYVEDDETDWEKYRYKDYLRTDSISGSSVISTVKVENSVKIDLQTDIFDDEKLKNKEIDYVTMTIGGNDVQFVDIVTTLLHPTYLAPNVLSQKIDYIKKTSFPKVEENLKEVYRTVSEKAGSQAHIVVAGYPKFMEPNGNGVLISKREATLVNNAISSFNHLISECVKDCEDSINISFVKVDFSGHEVYSKDPWLYNYEWLIKSDDISDFSIKNKVFVSAASFHPNEKGAKAYADAVNNEIKRLEAEKNNKNNNNNNNTTQKPGNNSNSGKGQITQSEIVGKWKMTLSLESFCENILNGGSNISAEDRLAMGFLLDLVGISKIEAVVEFKSNGKYDMVATGDSVEIFGSDYIQQNSNYKVNGKTLYFEVDEGTEYGFNCEFNYTYDGTKLTFLKNIEGIEHPYTGAVMQKIK